jgi:hypothetical protein
VVLAAHEAGPDDHASVLLWLDATGALDPAAPGGGSETIWEPAGATQVVGVERTTTGGLVGAAWDGAEMLLFSR